MFNLIKQEFIALLFYWFKSCWSYYYPFMLSLHKCSGSCNFFDDVSTKICVPSKIKDVNVIVFDMELMKWS